MAATVRKQGQPRAAKQSKPSKKGKSKECASPEALPSLPSVESSWQWTALTESLVSAVPPIFTRDGSYFFSLAGDSVRIYAAATGKVVSTLTAPSPTSSDVPATLTCAVLDPHNAFQLVTGSDSGVLAVWDFLEATLVQIIDIAQPIHYICAHENFTDTVFVSAGGQNKGGKESHAVVLSVSLKPADAASQSTTQKSSKITAVGRTRQPTGLAFSPRGNWLVATAGHKAYVASTASLRAGFTKYVSPERLTCLAFHPSEEYFATGDEKGVVRLWYCLTDQPPAKGVEKKTQTSSLHWHAHAVSSIAFTPNGAYLLSGGEESVLVIWQLHSGKREYLARLGSPIKTITVVTSANRDEEYLLGLADATYAFVSATTLKLSRTYSRVKLDPSALAGTTSSSSHLTPLSVHAPTSTLILPSSHPSSLQIFSPLSGTLVSELEVSPSNRVSRRDEKPIEPCRVERVAVSADGNWMASVDRREGDEDTHAESYLKIWSWDRKTGFWILNTRIDRPHGLQRVTAVAFSPSTALLATAGADGTVKTWRTQTTKRGPETQEEFWVARSTYNVHDESPSDVSWSPDGSLLAVTTPQQVALLAPLTNELLHTLAYPEGGQFNSSHFIGKGGQYVAVAGENEVLLWDLIALRVQWHHKYSGPLAALVVHPRGNTFAVVLGSLTSSSSQVVEVRAESPRSVRTVTIPFGLRNVVWYPLLSSFSLVGITHDWRVIVVGEEARIPKNVQPAATDLKAAASVQRRTLFEDIFGRSAFTEDVAASASSSSAAVPSSHTIGPSLFDAFTTSTTYLMPPLETFFDPILTTRLKPREPTEAPAQPDPEVEDVEMDVDIVVSSAPEGRNVERGELDTLVALFRRTLKARSPAPSIPTRKREHVNGTAHVNGSSTPKPPPAKVNGASKPEEKEVNRIASRIVVDSSAHDRRELFATLRLQPKLRWHGMSPSFMWLAAVSPPVSLLL
uniref:WD40 repeat-like protein n=1 Tax=Mycena chlorophos TaxID=658473 RepID=A0ABQ0M7H7_MYCCL|nr:WD40 repeat-like protein [Mycena chlorophos]